MQIHHLTNKAIAVTGLPEGATGFCIETGCLFTGPSSNNDWDLHGRVELPEGNWSILGFSKDLKEEQCELITPYEYDGTNDENINGYIYECFDESNFTCDNAKDSFHTLLKSKGLYVSNPFKEGKPSLLNNDVWYSLEQWQSAQLISNPLILIQ